MRRTRSPRTESRAPRHRLRPPCGIGKPVDHQTGRRHRSLAAPSTTTSVSTPKRAVRSRHQLDQIIAGDVLHHPAAVLDHCTAAINEPHTKQVIAASANLYPPGSGNIGRNHPTDRRRTRGAEQGRDDPSARRPDAGSRRPVRLRPRPIAVPALATMVSAPGS